MVAPTAAYAVAEANAYHSCEPGYCLKYTRTWLGVLPLENDAAAAWRNAEHQHPGDRNPPRGAPVFWTGGPNGHGHVALSLGGGRIRSTDQLNTGQVSSVDLGHIETDWGLTFAGWTQDINGVLLPYLFANPWAQGLVYVEKMHRGQADSDSVSRLRYRLMHHDRIPESVQPGLGNDWGPRVTVAVKYLQNDVMPQVNGPKDGLSLSNPQANVLFGDTYDVVEATA